jgi:hypothetical protein
VKNVKLTHKSLQLANGPTCNKVSEKDRSVLHIHRDVEMVAELRFHLLGFYFIKQVTLESRIK